LIQYLVLECAKGGSMIQLQFRTGLHHQETEGARHEQHKMP
jgi:hypothetical protein